MDEGKAINITDENYESEVLNSEVPVVVDFGAEWCGPCRMTGLVLDKIAEEYEGRLKVCKVDVDEQRGAAIKAGIQNIPTINIYKDGEIVDQMRGVTLSFESDLKEKIDSHL